MTSETNDTNHPAPSSGRSDYIIDTPPNTTTVPDHKATTKATPDPKPETVQANKAKTDHEPVPVSPDASQGQLGYFLNKLQLLQDHMAGLVQEMRVAAPNSDHAPIATLENDFTWLVNKLRTHAHAIF